jgi:hypothetical protein
MIRKILGLLTLTQLATLAAFGQAASEKPLLAEEVFKNIQVLKGIPVNEFMETMGFFSAATGLNCVDCHVADSLQNWAKFADDVPAKRTARTMVQMVNSINRANFGGSRALTCYSCHRGAPKPKTVPSLAEQNSSPPDEDPNEVEIIDPNPTGPAAEQILDKYIQAIGGAQALAKLTSYTAKGKYSGYDTSDAVFPAEVFAKAPGSLSLVVHGRLGDNTTTFSGAAGWIAGPDKPVPVLAVPKGDDLDGLKVDADLSIPVDLKRSLNQWRTGFPAVTIDDHDMAVVQGLTAGRMRVKLFFDKESGLLVRQVRFANTAVGPVPTEVDYSDYRSVAGVKIPFRMVLTWTSGRSTLELSDVQPNVAIPPARFAKPAPPAAPRQ